MYNEESVRGGDDVFLLCDKVQKSESTIIPFIPHSPPPYTLLHRTLSSLYIYMYSLPQENGLVTKAQILGYKTM